MERRLAVILTRIEQWVAVQLVSRDVEPFPLGIELNAVRPGE
jgi:hypothetical protein